MTSGTAHPRSREHRQNLGVEDHEHDVQPVTRHHDQRLCTNAQGTSDKKGAAVAKVVVVVR